MIGAISYIQPHFISLSRGTYILPFSFRLEQFSFLAHLILNRLCDGELWVRNFV